MAYSTALVDRIRVVLGDHPGVESKHMFGGVAFLVNGHMCCGVVDDSIMLRLGEAGASSALQEPHVRPMDFTGRPMKTMVFVDADGVRSARELQRWLGAAVGFARSLAPKSPPVKKAERRRKA